MDEKEQMKIAIIGLGDIAQKAYLPIITQIKDIELVFCTRNRDTLDQLASQYRVHDTCTNYQEIPNFAVDAVMIHAATSVHTMMASFFLEMGIPTFVDKPLADSASECEALYQLAIKTNTPLYVGFNRRHIPLYNQALTNAIKGENDSLLSLRWEKNRFDLVGELKTFIFDDFIHALDSVNIHAKSDINGIYITQQFEGQLLARVDVHWQEGNTLLHASMNRSFGITKERISANFKNCSYEFDSFITGKKWENNTEQCISLQDWTPMLASKGFEAMIQDWLTVVKNKSLPAHIAKRNLASHQLAEAIYQYLNNIIK